MNARTIIFTSICRKLIWKWIKAIANGKWKWKYLLRKCLPVVQSIQGWIVSFIALHKTFQSLVFVVVLMFVSKQNCFLSSSTCLHVIKIVNTLNQCDSSKYMQNCLIAFANKIIIHNEVDVYPNPNSVHLSLQRSVLFFPVDVFVLLSPASIGWILLCAKM